MATQTKTMSLLLLGKTGYGKSSTGNSLLNNKSIFKKSGDATSETKDVKLGESMFGGYRLKVIDAPGLQDTDLNDVQDKETSITKMDEALALCCGGVDAFIVVIHYGRFTQEDISTIEALKSIIGDKFLSHVVVVVTGGDTFENDKEDAGRNESFNEWCQRQEEKGFKQLYKDCGGRFVLFNNYERDENKKQAQIWSVVQLVETINKTHGRYTHQCFKNAETKREKMLLKMEEPQLTPKFEIKIHSLCLDIETFSRGAGIIGEENVRESMLKLRKEIEDKDKGHGVLKRSINMMDTMKEQLDDAVVVRQLYRDLGDATSRSEISSQMMTPLVQISAEVAKLTPKFGIGLGVVSLAATGIVKIVSSIQAAELQEELKRRERIMKSRKDDLGRS